MATHQQGIKSKSILAPKNAFLFKSAKSIYLTKTTIQLQIYFSTMTSENKPGAYLKMNQMVKFLRHNFKGAYNRTCLLAPRPPEKDLHWRPSASDI